MPSDREVYKDGLFLGIASSIGKLSTCDRGQCGALVVRRGRCVSWGYNGAPPGMPHCDENNHGWLEDAIDWVCPKTLDVPESKYQDVQDRAEELVEQYGCRNATHAEANALASAAREGISTDGATMYVVSAPCLNCARLILAAGIERVVYGIYYRDPAGVQLLDRAEVAVEHLH